MGTYLNPGNSGFEQIRKGEYVDKSAMIGLLNKNISSGKCLNCVSRPRRFGKSYAAQMLCAYYDKTVDSRCLFEDLAVSQEKSFEKYINKYDVIYLDMASLKPYTDNYEKLVEFIVRSITDEIRDSYPEVNIKDDFPSTLVNTVQIIGNKFVVIIDEWDAPIRENPLIREQYLDLLRSLFKNSGITAKVFAIVYMTGILPIKKDGSQSAISDFEEYSMLNPGAYADYVGFTEDEVKICCKKYDRSFEKMKRWFDGYSVGEKDAVYNPYSVMQALISGVFKSYWKKTSAAETLMTYIDIDQDGLQDTIARLIAGESVVVDTDSFQNDIESFACKDDVLTLLIHLGYLTYQEVSDSYDEEDDELTGITRIPNEEVRTEFDKILRKSKHRTLINLVKKSDQLLADTLAGNSKAVADTIAEIRETHYAPTFYNDEQALRYLIKMAYISCVDQYAKIEELPSGHGLADVVFIPKRRSVLPAMIIELKWNKHAEGAIRQIKTNGYSTVLKEYGGEIVLVGVNYDKRTKVHTCVIEKTVTEK